MNKKQAIKQRQAKPQQEIPIENLLKGNLINSDANKPTTLEELLIAKHENTIKQHEETIAEQDHNNDVLLNRIETRDEMIQSRDELIELQKEQNTCLREQAQDWENVARENMEDQEQEREEQKRELGKVLEERDKVRKECQEEGDKAAQLQRVNELLVERIRKLEAQSRDKAVPEVAEGVDMGLAKKAGAALEAQNRRASEPEVAEGANVGLANEGGNTAERTQWPESISVFYESVPEKKGKHDGFGKKREERGERPESRCVVS